MCCRKKFTCNIVVATLGYRLYLRLCLNQLSIPSMRYIQLLFPAFNPLLAFICLPRLVFCCPRKLLKWTPDRDHQNRRKAAKWPQANNAASPPPLNNKMTIANMENYGDQQLSRQSCKTSQEFTCFMRPPASSMLLRLLCFQYSTSSHWHKCVREGKEKRADHPLEIRSRWASYLQLSLLPPLFAATTQELPTQLDDKTPQTGIQHLMPVLSTVFCNQ